MRESEDLHLPQKKIMGGLTMIYGTPWIITAVAGTALFSLAGIVFDYRFFVLALMWIFLILPMVVAFLYFYYGLQPLTAVNSIPHKLIIDNNTLRVKIIYYGKESGKTEDRDTESIEIIQSKKKEEEGKEYVLHFAEVTNIKYSPGYQILFFGNRQHKGWLWVPLNLLRGENLDMASSIQTSSH